MTGFRPISLNQQQRQLLNQFSQARLEMTPQAFLAKWDVNQTQLAIITNRSRSAVKKWFSRGNNYREAGVYTCLRLGLANWLLENTNELSESLLSSLFRNENS